MKQRSLLWAALGLLLLTQYGRGEEYRDAAKHFVLQLPDGWTKCDPAFVAQMNEVVRQRMPGQTIRYDTGFQPRGKQSGEYPYILVQWQPGSLPSSYEEIERGLNQGRPTAAKKAEGAFSDVLSKLTMGEFSVDRDRNRALIQMQSDIAGIGKVQSLSVNFLGKDGMLALHCYDHAGDFSNQLPMFNKIFDTFQFDQGYAYQPGGWLSTGIARAALIGAIAGFVAAGAFLLIMLKRKQAAG